MTAQNHEKKRLDVLLTEKGYASSRERAKAMIMEGVVFVNGIREDKPGSVFYPDKILKLEVKENTLPYVSRGGLKLEKALKEWNIDLENRICLDIGASTGGFTDCMLQHGALKVYSVDSGYGQLSYSLRTDPRVICMEKTNFRYLKPEDIADKPLFAAADVSFISLDKIFPAAFDILHENARMVALIKPQFEAGRDKVGKKGVVRDRNVHKDVILKIMRCAEDTGFYTKGLSFSPIQGPEGNIEYLIYLTKENKADCTLPDAERVTEEAHGFFLARSSAKG